MPVQWKKHFALLLTLGMLSWLYVFAATPGVAADENTSWLNAHNTYRATHNAPPVTWSDELARSAGQWASTCPSGHSGGIYGENIAWATYDMEPRDVVKLWYDEIEKYDFSNPGFNLKTGHFTQVVWKNTTQIGCAHVEGCGNWQHTWVCEYSPAGNIIGQFAQNVSPKNGSTPSQTQCDNNNTWDGTTYILTLRGIDIAGNNDPDESSVFAVMKLVGFDPEHLRFELLQADWDSEHHKGTYYPDSHRLKFLIDLDQTCYEVTMAMETGDQGQVYFILTSIAEAPHIL